MALLEAIMAGLGGGAAQGDDADPSNSGGMASGALRETCAKLSAEFLKWSAKHMAGIRE